MNCYVLVQHLEDGGLSASDVLGVFSSKEEAEKAKDECVKLYIREAKVNKTRFPRVMFEVECHILDDIKFEGDDDST